MPDTQTVLDGRAYSEGVGDKHGPSTYEIVHRWHDDTHQGVFRFCEENPCYAIHVARNAAG